MATPPTASKRSVTSLQWLNFFVADIQTGVGPFLATYLAAQHWSPRDVGFALTFGGLITVLSQTPAGAFVDSARSKRAVLATAISFCAVGAVLIAINHSRTAVAAAQICIGLAGAFLLPTLGAITLGLVGDKRFAGSLGGINLSTRPEML
ncbi:hypothetical protein BH10ACI4_BH10ACI4_24830 [soil metagenome]